MIAKARTAPQSRDRPRICTSVSVTKAINLANAESWVGRCVIVRDLYIALYHLNRDIELRCNAQGVALIYLKA